MSVRILQACANFLCQPDLVCDLTCHPVNGYNWNWEFTASTIAQLLKYTTLFHKIIVKISEILNVPNSFLEDNFKGNFGKEAFIVSVVLISYEVLMHLNGTFLLIVLHFNSHENASSHTHTHNARSLAHMLNFITFGVHAWLMGQNVNCDGNAQPVIYLFLSWGFQLKCCVPW